MAQHGGQLVEHRLAEAGWQAGSHAGDYAAYSILRRLRRPDAGFHAGGRGGVGAAHGVAVDEGQV